MHVAISRQALLTKGRTIVPLYSAFLSKAFSPKQIEPALCSIEVSSENLKTIEKYALFRHLIDSTGIVDEPVLDKLKLNIRSLIASQEEDSKELLDLCIDVIYHNNMKAFGLQQLIKLYLTWLSTQDAEEEEE